MKETPRVAIANCLLLPQIKDLILNGHTVTILVRGNSMNPFMVDRRDKVTIAPLNHEPRIGDLLLAYDAPYDRYVLHRLIRTEYPSAGKSDSQNSETMYVLMGDGNTQGTECILRQDIIGVVTAILRKKRAYSTNSILWKGYSAAWISLKPVRRWLLAGWRRI